LDAQQQQQQFITLLFMPRAAAMALSLILLTQLSSVGESGWKKSNAIAMMDGQHNECSFLSRSPIRVRRAGIAGQAFAALDGVPRQAERAQWPCGA